VRGDDAFNDEEPQPEALARGVLMAPLEGLEDIRLERFGDAGPRVVDAQADLVLRCFHLHADGSTRRAVLERVAHQVGDHLGQPVRIPLALALLGLGELEVPLRVRGPVFLHDLTDDLVEVCRPGLHGDGAPHANAGQVQQVPDDPRRALSA